MKKKIAMGLGALTAIAAPTATLVACGDKNDDGIIKVPEVKAREAVTPASFAFKGKQVYLALDGKDHSQADKSFNQQSWEGIKAVSGYSSHSVNTYVKKPSDDNKKGFTDMYNGIPDGSVIVAPGFLHGDKLKDANGKTATKNKTVIYLDGDVKAGNIASVIFKPSQAGFLAGVQSGYVLNEHQKDFGNELKVGTFGGLNIPSVTGYMAGFQKGVEYFNAHKPATIIGVTTVKDIEFIDLGKKADYFSGGFAPGMGTDISNKLLDKGADLIFPVAGPQTADVDTAIKSRTGSKTKIVGVDVPQEATFDNVVFSALKDLKTSTTNLIKVIALGQTIANFDGGLGKATIGDLDNGLVGVSNGKTSKVSAQKTFVSNAANTFATTTVVKTAAKSMNLEFKF